MLSESESKYLTKTEIKYLAAMASHSTVKEAALSIGESPQVLYNFTYALRRKYLNRRGWINAIIAQKKRSPLLKQQLTFKAPMVAVAGSGSEEDSWEEEE